MNFSIQEGEQLWQIIRTPSETTAVFRQDSREVRVSVMEATIQYEPIPLFDARPYRRYRRSENPTCIELVMRLADFANNFCHTFFSDGGKLVVGDSSCNLELYCRASISQRFNSGLETGIARVELYPEISETWITRANDNFYRTDVTETISFRVEGRTRQSFTERIAQQVLDIPNEYTRRVLQNLLQMPLEEWKPENKIPSICQNCKYLHGKSYGGSLLVCAIHPSGCGEDCKDFEEDS